MGLVSLHAACAWAISASGRRRYSGRTSSGRSACRRPASRQWLIALTLWSSESSSGTEAPERSRTSLNSTAPSPTASTAGPSARDQLAERLRGAARAGAAAARVELARPRRAASRPRTPRRGARRAPPAPRPARPRPRRHAAPRQRERLERRDRRPAGCPRARASARAVAIPIRSPVNVPGPTPTAIRSTSSQPTPAALEHLDDQRQQARGVAAGARPARGSSRALERDAVRIADSATAVARGGGVEGQDPHAISTQPRSSPPACSSRTRAAIARQARASVRLAARRPLDERDRVRARGSRRADRGPRRPVGRPGTDRRGTTGTRRR